MSSASQERAPVCTDPLALADGFARGGSASFEADVKADSMTPASPLRVVSNLATEGGSDKTAYPASFAFTGEALPQWTGISSGKDSFPQVHQQNRDQKKWLLQTNDAPHP
jgi:hypothetical protein